MPNLGFSQSATGRSQDAGATSPAMQLGSIALCPQGLIGRRAGARPGQPAPRRPALVLILSIGAIALLVAACGGGSSDGGDQVASLGDAAAAAADGEGGSTTTTALDPEEASLAFEECMAEHGVEVHVFAASEGEPNERSLQVDELEPSEDRPPPPDPEALEAAQEECNPLLQGAFGELELSPEQEAEMRDAQLELQRCLEDRGIDGFEPDGDDGGFEMRLDPEAEDFEEVQEAMRECSDSAGIVDVVPGGRQMEETP